MWHQRETLKRRAALRVGTLVVSLGCAGQVLGQPAQATDEERAGLGVLAEGIDRSALPVKPKPKRAEPIERWNQIALDANALDHTPIGSGETRTFGEQLGPARTSRAFAIVHIAMFDALNAIEGCYESYSGIPPMSVRRASARAAVAQAARDTLVALYPSQASSFDAALAEDLLQVRGPGAKEQGIDLGHRAAAAILQDRALDGSEVGDPFIGDEYITSDDPGFWRQDPISQIPLAVGAYWGAVRPFVISQATAFRVPEPPALTSEAYAAAFDEVKRLGGDGAPGGTPTERTAEQTEIGLYWSYDGTPGLGTPPRLYNQIALTIAKQKKSTGIELARLLAMLNVALADAAIVAWESKFHYQLWRPIAGIREADEGTGPSRLGDGNPNTVGDPTFTPLGASATNLNGPNFTPPFPAYPSGHASFGGAVFETLRRFYRTDRIRFTFVSDEFNGENRGSGGVVRPRKPRSFETLSQAEEENGVSRIYLGVHWRFDSTEGTHMGHLIADEVFDRTFAPQQCRPNM